MKPQNTEDDGWTLRGVYGQPRLDELSCLYEELGFLVKTAPFHPDQVSGCNQCLKGFPDQHRALFTKKIDSLG